MVVSKHNADEFDFLALFKPQNSLVNIYQHWKWAIDWESAKISQKRVMELLRLPKRGREMANTVKASVRAPKLDRSL